MGSEPDFVKKKFAPLLDKTLKTALAHKLGTEFPRLGGPGILDLCAEMILETITHHVRPRESLTHGQALWMAVSIDDPPARGKTIARTDLVPVVLDISTAEDVQDVIDRVPARGCLLKKALRLCQQSHQQGGLLSNSDLAMLLNCSNGEVSRLIAQYERDHAKIIPRRATLHDVGTAVTHKRIICWKHYAQGKTSDQIARETYHSMDAVDRYLGQFDRVKHCNLQGMSAAETAFTLNCSLSLVNQYLEIQRELEDARA